MGGVHRFVHSHTYTHKHATHTEILEGKDMPYGVTCRFLLQLQPVGKRMKCQELLIRYR